MYIRRQHAEERAIAPKVSCTQCVALLPPRHLVLPNMHADCTFRHAGSMGMVDNGKKRHSGCSRKANMDQCFLLPFYTLPNRWMLNVGGQFLIILQYSRPGLLGWCLQPIRMTMMTPLSTLMTTAQLVCPVPITLLSVVVDHNGQVTLAASCSFAQSIQRNRHQAMY